MIPSFNLLVILGPTASGKTSLAVKLARQFNGEVISADSRQVYRGLDIGSGKDLHEYGEIPYHLIDIVDPGFEFSVFDFQQHFYEAFDAIISRGKLPILAGGSGLYVDSVIKGYDLLPVGKNSELRAELSQYSIEQLKTQLLKIKPIQHNTTDLIERDRLVRAIEIATAEQSNKLPQRVLPKLKPLIIGIRLMRETTRKLITSRLQFRLENGLIEEVQALHDKGEIPWTTLEYFGLEYRLVAQFLQQQFSYSDMFQKLNTAIHQFAKKQDTWLRRLQKQGHFIHWVDGQKEPFGQAATIINKAD